MARRQMELAGTRTEKDPPLALVEAGEDLVEQKRIARREAEKIKEKYAGVIAVMQATKTEHFQVKDPDTGEYLEFDLELVPKLTIRKSGELDTAVGDAVDTGPRDEPGVHPGLIADAERAQAAAQVEETADGDVAVPDAPAPKAKKSKAKKDRN